MDNETTLAAVAAAAAAGAASAASPAPAAAAPAAPAAAAPAPAPAATLTAAERLAAAQATAERANADLLAAQQAAQATEGNLTATAALELLALAHPTMAATVTPLAEAARGGNEATYRAALLKQRADAQANTPAPSATNTTLGADPEAPKRAARSEGLKAAAKEL